MRGRVKNSWSFGELLNLKSLMQNGTVLLKLHMPTSISSHPIKSFKWSIWNNTSSLEITPTNDLLEIQWLLQYSSLFFSSKYSLRIFLIPYLQFCFFGGSPEWKCASPLKRMSLRKSLFFCWGSTDLNSCVNYIL